jgi:ketosteroid isomerase-like protein
MRRAVEALNRRDLDAVLSLFAPNAVWEMVPLSRSFEGLAAVRGFLADWLGGYEEYVVEVEEVLEFGNGVTFAVTSQEGRLVGARDRARLRERWAYVFLWVDGMIARLASHTDIDQGRAAAERLAEERG